MEKKYAGIKYRQRPRSYWRDRDVLSALLRDVKGTERRDTIRNLWKQGRLEALSDELLGSSLPEATRTGLGRIHPRFMGGEYLPEYYPGETEIARISLQSTMRDVISIRARKDGPAIRYRVVDEYKERYRTPIDTSARPFNLAELIEFIDGCHHPDLGGGLVFGFNEMNNVNDDPSEVAGFTHISSQLYPQLSEHYDHVYDDWLKEQQEEKDALRKEQEQERFWAELVEEEKRLNSEQAK